MPSAAATTEAEPPPALFTHDLVGASGEGASGGEILPLDGTVGVVGVELVKARRGMMGKSSVDGVRTRGLALGLVALVALSEVTRTNGGDKGTPTDAPSSSNDTSGVILFGMSTLDRR